MIVEETEKMYKVLAKNFVDEILGSYPVNIISPHLPLLAIFDKANSGTIGC
jgi:hypothetical protein